MIAPRGKGIAMSRSHPTNPPLLLKPQQAAETLQISERKLWSMTSSGEVPHIRLGRSVRYPIADLEHWIDGQKSGGQVDG